MARHKIETPESANEGEQAPPTIPAPPLHEVIAEEMPNLLLPSHHDAILATKSEPEPVVYRTLVERRIQAVERLESSKTLAEICYWQGALDMLDAYSRGEQMPSIVGKGVAA